MIYDYALTVEHGKTEAEPATMDLVLTKGIIHRVEVEFYEGCRRYVSVAIFRGGHQVWPTNPDGVFCTNDWTIAFDEYEEITTHPIIYTVKAWSPDADYDHVIVVRIGLMESRSAVLLLTALKGMIKFLKLMKIKV